MGDRRITISCGDCGNETMETQQMNDGNVNTAVAGRHGRLVMWLKRRLCAHKFAIEDLEQTKIPEPVKPTSKNYDEWMTYLDARYAHDSHTKRVRWPCAKCGQVFYAHCGLDITPAHGPMFRRSAT